jgi:opacity protein-like surface antigen
MKLTTRSIMLRLLDRAVIGAMILLVMLLAGMQVARAGEIVPSIGITKTIDNDDGDAKIFGGLAFRGSLAPMLKSEIGLAYRDESFADDNLKVRMWPLTASLWLSPLPTLYAGGGVGWYHTTFDYAESLPLQDETQQKFGVHLGGGFGIPIGPVAALDLNGRYVFLDQEASALPPNGFDPDFWTTSVGLAIKF